MFRNVFYNGISDAVRVATAILSSIVLTRLLGPQRWGEYSQLLWLIGFASAVLSFGLPAISVRYLAALSVPSHQYAQKRLFNQITLIQLSVLFLGCGIIVLFASSILRLTGWNIDAKLIQIASFSVFSYAMIQLGSAMLRGLQKFQTISLLSLLSSFAAFLTIPAVLLVRSTAMVLVAFAIGHALILPWLFRVVRMAVYPRNDSGVAKSPLNTCEITRYAGVVYFAVLLDLIVWQRSEILFLGKLPDASHSGFYSLAYTVSLIAIGTLPTALTGVLTPMFSSSFSAAGLADLSKAYQRSFGYLNLVVLPLTAGTVSIAPQLILTVYGNSYTAVVSVLRILAVSTAIGLYARPSASALHAQNKPHILLISSLLALPIDLLLAWQMVPRLAGEGAAIANVSAQTVAAGIAIGYTSRELRVKYDWISIGKCAISAGICGVLAWSTCTLLPSSILTIAFAVLLGAMGYFVALVTLRHDLTIEFALRIRTRIKLKAPKLGRDLGPR